MPWRTREESSRRRRSRAAGATRETIAPAISFLCQRAAVSLEDLDGICIDIGPGLFTGLRVGISTAKALGFALGLPIAVATSLEVLAHAVAGAGVKDGLSVVPVVDARRKEVFSARFSTEETNGKGEGGDGTHALRQVEPDNLTTPRELALRLEDLEEKGQPLVLVGDGALRYRDVLPGRVASSDLAWPPVGVLARLGASRLSSGAGVAASEVRPSYLREADVRINWEQRLPPRPSGAPEVGAPLLDAHGTDMAEARHVSGGRAG